MQPPLTVIITVIITTITVIITGIVMTVIIIIIIMALDGPPTCNPCSSLACDEDSDAFIYGDDVKKGAHDLLNLYNPPLYSHKGVYGGLTSKPGPIIIFYHLQCGSLAWAHWP